MQTTRNAHHPSNKLYRGEVENGEDALLTLIAACTFEIRDFTVFLNSERELADEMSNDIARGYEQTIAELEKHRDVAQFALTIWRGTRLNYASADETDEQVAETLRGTIPLIASWKFTLRDIADALEAHDYQALAI